MSGSFIYDSANPVLAPAHVLGHFEVKNDDVGLLQVSGLSGLEEIPIEVAVGPRTENAWAPFSMNGDTAVLSVDNANVRLDPPGWYRINVSALAPAQRVRVFFRSLELKQMAYLPSPFSGDDDACPILPDRGILSGW